MEFDPHDQDIVGLLTKLKTVEGGYPDEMLAARRQNYLNQMAQLGLGAGLATGLREVAKNASTPTVPPVTSTLLEVALALAILAEASTVAYFYRDRIANFFQGNTTDSRVQEIASVAPTVLEVQESTLTPSPASTATIPSTVAPVTVNATGITVTLSSTPIPGVADDNHPGIRSTAVPGVVDNNNPTVNTPSSGAAVNQPNSNSTPAPNADKDNPGNHYGQTPKPERTKESGNNDTGNTDPGNTDTGSTNNDNNTNDTPPETNKDQTPKDNPKPTKTK